MTTEGNTWLLPSNIQNKADHIWVETDNPTGCSGRRIEFNLANGDTIKVKGPWHTNANSLYNATGIDYRDLTLTWGLIAERRIDLYVYENILYIDQKPTLGIYTRIKDLANSLTQEVAYHVNSHGGSTSGFNDLYQAAIKNNRRSPK